MKRISGKKGVTATIVIGLAAAIMLIEGAWTGIGIYGLATSVLLTGWLLALADGNRRARSLAAEMTARMYESQANLAEAERIARIGNWMYDLAAQRFDISEQARLMFGVRGDGDMQPGYRWFLRRIYRTHRPAFFDLLRTATKHSVCGTIDIPLDIGDGHSAWMHMVVSPTANEVARVKIVRGTILDITERKRAELRRETEIALDRTLDDARTIEEVAPRLIERLCRTLGWDGGVRWGWDAQQQCLQTRESWSCARPAVADFIAYTCSGFKLGGSGRLKTAVQTGEPNWVADLARKPAATRGAHAARAGLHGAYAFPIIAGGKVLGVMEFFSRDHGVADNALLDVMRAIGARLGQFCQRKQAEEALRNSEERLHGIVNMAHEAIMAVDEEFNIVLFNPAAEKMFGCPAAIAIGSGIDRFIPLHLRETHRQHMARFTTNGESGRRMGERMKVNALRTGGEVFSVEASIAKLTQSGRRLYSVILNDVSERKRDEERLNFLANYDPLTSLPNRALFNKRLQRAIGQSGRTDRGLAVLFIDLDRFKNINDTLGHEAGDQVLREVSSRLTACLREVDTVARLGGDEFVILIEQLADTRYAGSVAQKLIRAVAAPITLGDSEYNVTASVGISSYPADGDDGATLLKNADIAMYRAKEQGKNNFQFYAAQMNAHSVTPLMLEASPRRVIEPGDPSNSRRIQT